MVSNRYAEVKDEVTWLQMQVTVAPQQPLTPGQQHVSQGDVVEQDAGHTQRHHHQPAHERHGPVKCATDTNTHDYRQSDKPIALTVSSIGA